MSTISLTELIKSSSVITEAKFINDLKTITIKTTDFQSAILALHHCHCKSSTISLIVVAHIIENHIDIISYSHLIDLLLVLDRKCMLNKLCPTTLIHLLNVPFVEKHYFLLRRTSFTIDYNTWIQRKTFQNWHIDFIIAQNISSVQQNFPQFINIIQSHNLKLTLLQLSHLTDKLVLTEEIINHIITTTNYNPYTYDHLKNFIQMYCLTPDNNTIDNFNNVIRIFSEKNIKLSIDQILDLCADRQRTQQILLTLIIGPYFQPQSITHDHLLRLFQCQISINAFNPITLPLLTVCSYVPTESDLVFLCTTNNINLISYSSVETMFINTLKSKNYPLTKLFFDHKFVPKEEYIYNHFVPSNYDADTTLINLFISYGLHISPLLYTYIKMQTCAVDTTTLSASPILEQSINTINSSQHSTQKPRFTQIKNIKNLARLYETSSLSEIKDMIKKSTKKIQPDISCFVASLRDSSPGEQTWGFFRSASL